MAIQLSDCFIGNFPETQGFGARPDYYKQFGLNGHEGIDFGLPVGTPVIAATNGVVSRDTDDPIQGKNYGINVVLWDTEQLCLTYYCHLSSNVVSVGQKIVAGQLLGYSGNTGNTTGPHLHFNLAKTDASGNRLNQTNGYLGFINPDDKRIAQWNIKNPTKPTEPPPITVPTDHDEENAMQVLKNAHISLPDTDNLKAGNLEGYTRAITGEHLDFQGVSQKAKILDGFIAKFLGFYKLTTNDGLNEIEAEMQKDADSADKAVLYRSAIEDAVQTTFTDDEALLKSLQALRDENKTLSDKVAEYEAISEKPVSTFKLGKFIVRVFKGV